MTVPSSRFAANGSGGAGHNGGHSRAGHNGSGHNGSGRPGAGQHGAGQHAAGADEDMLWGAEDPGSAAREPMTGPGPGRRSPAGPSALRLVWIYPDQPVPSQGDIYLLGGGEDLPQVLAARRLRGSGGLSAAVQNGAVTFAVCAGYQLIGSVFGGAQGEPVDGLGILDISSGRGERRGVGEVLADVDPQLGVDRLTGFENHQGVTKVGSGARPLARVTLGVGNGDGTEGAYVGRTLGTYLHGPALVRNPGLADLLLSWAAGPLPPLPDADETWTKRLRAERLAAVST